MPSEKRPYRSLRLVKLDLCDPCIAQIRAGGAVELCAPCKAQFASRVHAGASLMAGDAPARRRCPACELGELEPLEPDQAERLMPLVRQSIGDPTLDGYACTRAECRAFIAIGKAN